MESPWVGCLKQLRQALGSAMECPVECVAVEERLASLVDLHDMRTTIDALWCRALSAGPVGSALGETGHRSVADLIAAETRSSPRSLRADQRLGSWLADYPVFGEAFAAGRLSKEHLRAIRARENPRTRPYLADAQHYLVEAAAACQWSEYLAVLRYWELAADPDGEEPEEQVRARSLNYTRHADGTVTARLNLDPLGGHAFTTVLERKTQALFREDAEAGSLRTAGQRRADALLGLLTTSGARSNAAVLTNVVMSERVAAAHFRALAGDEPPDRLSIDPHDADGRCELIDGVPLHPHFAVAAMAVSDFRRHVMSSEGECTDLGRKARGFPPHLKEALLVRARGRCRQPGCDAPLAWLQADHLIPWSRGGATALANGQILCDAHNKLKRDRPPPASDP